MSRFRVGLGRLEPLRRELRRRRRLALARLLARTRPRPDRPVWLFGGSVGAAYGDNSAALHRYVVLHHPEIRAYWVIDRDSPDVDVARAVGPVLFMDDLQTYVTALQAEVHVISHGLHDIPTCASSHSKAFKVRLGHGLTALKKTKPPPLRTLEQAFGVFGLVPVSSEFEKANKGTWEISPDRIVVTGLPRFDDLARKAREHEGTERTVLYMPTWREWLPHTRDDMLASEFLRQVRGFLGHPALGAVLEAHDLVLEVYLHRMMRDEVAGLLEGASSSRIRLLPTKVDVQDHLARASALVTDYSSVTWDMLYLGRPVVFFTFDVDEYERHRGGYLDLRNDLPGPSAAEPGALVDLLDRVAREGWRLTPAAERWSERVFPWRDENNCERVVDAIFARLPR
ncbi:MAG: CDP-glycerol glycerophosphotransferase family protein [Alphaproteobacteria bacterium]|nr:CDP-glycerol glycerophosphotransferase family protein [Alphaproteobacteria bacterium]